MSVPVVPRRTFAPRTNSWTTVVATVAHSAKQIPETHSRTPNAVTAASVTTHAVAGHRNWLARFFIVDLRHASSGPKPVRNSSVSPIGSIHLLKNGGPTVMRSPVTASLKVGNIVANRTKNALNRRIQLLTRKAASRDAHESSVLRARNSGRR